MKNQKILLTVLAAALAAGSASACPCGCGVFDVATASMLPQGPGGMFFTEYDYMDQNMNWLNNRPAPAANNGDNDIRTDFLTVGLQYMFDRSWGFQVELPYDFRHYAATGGGSVSWSGFGDARIEGIYTGFSPDMSAGITFGLKLPTGDDHFDNSFLDRDLELGSGSTDLLLGGFYRHEMKTIAPGLFWFSQVELDVPMLTQGGYRPGVELDTSAGVYYQGLSLGSVQITPVAQIIPSLRTSDTGPNSAGGANDGPVGQIATGYERILLSPGIEFDVHPFKIYGDVEFDVLQNTRGNQLVSPVLFKVAVTYMF